MAISENYYAIRRGGAEVVQWLPADVPETERTALLTQYTTDYTGPFTAVLVPSGNLSSYAEIGDLVSARVQVSDAGVVSAFVPGTALSNTENAERWKRELSQAFAIYQDGVSRGGRRVWWPSMRTGTNADRPLVATDRWAYQQIALGSQIADRVAFATLTDTQRGAVIDHIVTMISTIGETWYNVMVGQEGESDGGYSAEWAEASVAANDVIYSDIVTTTGATRGPDGAFTALPVLIPTGFKPDTPTLR